jgi:F-type H+-transporting ATPase subunit delta
MTEELQQLVELAQPDVSERRLARVYAEALLNAAEKQNAVEEILVELEGLVGDVRRRDPYVLAFFTSGVIGKSTRENIIKTAFQERSHPLLVRALLVLNDHDRLALLRPLVEELKTLHQARCRHLPVTVQAAVPLADDQRQRLVEFLKDAFQLEPILDVQVDPDLLGGVVVRIADMVFDGSVRTQILNMRKQLLENASHEIQSGRDRLSLAT